MENFERHLRESLKNENFAKEFEKEKTLLGIGIKIALAREQQGLTQSALAEKAKISQQQLSKIENGHNCNLLTFIKVKNALNIDIRL